MHATWSHTKTTNHLAHQTFWTQSFRTTDGRQGNLLQKDPVCIPAREKTLGAHIGASHKNMQRTVVSYNFHGTTSWFTKLIYLANSCRATGTRSPHAGGQGMTFQDLICQTKTSSVQNSLPQKKKTCFHPSIRHIKDHLFKNHCRKKSACFHSSKRHIKDHLFKNHCRKKRTCFHPSIRHIKDYLFKNHCRKKKACFHPSIRHIKDSRGKRRLAGKVKTTVLCGESPNVPLGDFPFQLSVTVMNPCHEAKGDFPKAKSRW